MVLVKDPSDHPSYTPVQPMRQRAIPNPFASRGASFVGGVQASRRRDKATLHSTFREYGYFEYLLACSKYSIVHRKAEKQ